MISLVVRNLSARHFNFTIAVQRQHSLGLKTLALVKLNRQNSITFRALRAAPLRLYFVWCKSCKPSCLCALLTATDCRNPIQDFVDDFVERQLDGSIMVFEDPTSNPKWSFVKLDNKGFVTDVAEKKPISNLATVGIYLFRRTDIFIAAVKQMVAAKDRTNNEYYNAPAFNYLIQAGGRVGCFEIPMMAMKRLEHLRSERYLKENPALYDTVLYDRGVSAVFGLHLVG